MPKLPSDRNQSIDLQSKSVDWFLYDVLYNNKLIASTQITNTEFFALITVLVLKLLSRKVLFISRKDNRNF